MSGVYGGIDELDQIVFGRTIAERQPSDILKLSGTFLQPTLNGQYPRVALKSPGQQCFCRVDRPGAD
jgi:hypothetical protein